jgi:hypothetical protein
MFHLVRKGFRGSNYTPCHNGQHSELLTFQITLGYIDDRRPGLQWLADSQENSLVEMRSNLALVGSGEDLLNSPPLVLTTLRNTDMLENNKCIDHPSPEEDFHAWAIAAAQGIRADILSPQHQKPPPYYSLIC